VREKRDAERPLWVENPVDSPHYGTLLKFQSWPEADPPIKPRRRSDREGNEKKSPCDFARP
jgi:hypothetical protein